MIGLSQEVIILSQRGKWLTLGMMDRQRCARNAKSAVADHRYRKVKLKPVK